MPTPVEKDYEYAGFHYTIFKEHGYHTAAPHIGQHPAAGKAVHIRSAIECYLDDQNSKAKKVTL